MPCEDEVVVDSAASLPPPGNKYSKREMGMQFDFNYKCAASSVVWFERPLCNRGDAIGIDEVRHKMKIAPFAFLQIVKLRGGGGKISLRCAVRRCAPADMRAWTRATAASTAVAPPPPRRTPLPRHRTRRNTTTSTTLGRHVRNEELDFVNSIVFLGITLDNKALMSSSYQPGSESKAGPSSESRPRQIDTESGIGISTEREITIRPVLICAAVAALCTGLCAWCLWRARGCALGRCVPGCLRRPPSDRDSAGSCYPPPRYSRCGSFHQAPPPYSEVTSKPDLYPLVITCGDGDKGGGSYLMVHYFRNYIIRGPGEHHRPPSVLVRRDLFYEEWRGAALLRSLSSLTSERAGRAPPPRARTATSTRHHDLSPNDTFRETLITSPVQDSAYDLDLELIDYELECEGACRPRLGPSPPIHRSPSNVDETIYEHDIQNLRRMLAATPSDICESPPQPTSPTQSSRESTMRRPSDERRHTIIVKRVPKSRKTSLYMPLSTANAGRSCRISPGPKVSSRSAPATPCGALVPNLLSFSQRLSSSGRGSRSSRLEEENDPLLVDGDPIPFDHKF
ncbi:hypothetical protein EVAR_99003_1 [Eumeta japonica]|uniref:Uncharacterized protein n=1 Tax=Eumeta variegata TaxID=151549 RepID=A0A4C1Y027_EUMVA|nr:hypothetical protein EVAR_99003_1 [Eumeta japonica]